MIKNNLIQICFHQIRPVIAAICVGSFLFFSCSKEEQAVINHQPNLTVSEAKDWYLNNYPYLIGQHSQENTLKNSKADSIVPIFEWEKSLFERDNYEDVIEVPIHYSNGSVGHAFAYSGQLPASDDKRLHN